MKDLKTSLGRIPILATSGVFAAIFSALMIVAPPASARAEFFPQGSQLTGPLYVNNTFCTMGGTNDACGGAFATWHVLQRFNGGSFAVQYDNMACVEGNTSATVDVGYSSDGGAFSDGKFLTPGWIEDYIENPCWSRF
ncbi:hypothetical protein ABZS95_36905 [Streptomyces sp. NPDC005479]|uniref:hypothetical protein n=1 Tax=Streptomyces sp. NPDC005479 TaxID=3154879 RepID=UPI0033B91F70